MVSKVYFIEDKSMLPSSIISLLADYYLPNKEVVMKIHFGEPWNQYAFTSEDIKPIVDSLHTMSLDTLLIDTPVIYPSPRNSVESYTQVVNERWYTDISKCKIEDEYVKVPMKLFDCMVSKTMFESENNLVISHVKWHSCAWFGGAIKNLAMGWVWKSTKIVQHSLGAPVFVQECMWCWACARNCPEKTIEMIWNKAVIHYKRCIWCSICIYSCIYGCLAPKKACFDELLGHATASLINNMWKQTFYINTLLNIAENCDCYKDPWELLLWDIWILLSDNPVAIDKASIDLINEKAWKNVFASRHNKDPYLQIQYASQYTNLSSDYQLIKL